MTDQIQMGDVAPRVRYRADGRTSLFSYPFVIFNAGDLEVYVDDTLQSDEVYTISGVGRRSGGIVSFDTAPADNAGVTLVRRLPIQRITDFASSGEFRASMINAELDFQAAAQQQVNDDLVRSIRLSKTDNSADLVLPVSGDRAGRTLGFDSEGNITSQIIVDVSSGPDISETTPLPDIAGGQAGTSVEASAADHAHPGVSWSDIGISSQAEAEAGTDNVKLMTPLRATQAINALKVTDDVVARDMAASALAYVMASNDAAVVTGGIGSFLLADTFVEDSLDVSTNATHDSSGTYYHNTDAGTQTWSASLNGNDNGQENLSIRQVIPAAGLSSSGSAITIKVAASTSGGLSVDNVSIVERSGSTANGVTSPTEILFNGSSGFSISSGEELTSDVTAFTIDHTRDYLVVFDISSTKGNPRRIDGGGTYYVKSATDSYDQSEVSGFSSSSRTYIVNAIHVDPSAPDMSLTSSSASLVTPDPPDISGYFVIEAVDALDIEADLLGEYSLNGGMDFVSGSWTKVGDINAAGRTLYRLDADTSSLAGDQLVYRLVSDNAKTVRFHECTGIVPVY